MSNDQDNGDQEPNPRPEVNFAFDGDIGEAFGKGMDALQGIIGGVVQMAKDVAGPEFMKNLTAAQWLSQVAASIEETATGLREHGRVPPGKTGELTCHAERAATELNGSKFESQLPSLQQRIEETLQMLERSRNAATPESTEQDINQLADTVGYFKAAASSVVPVSSPENQDKR